MDKKLKNRIIVLLSLIFALLSSFTIYATPYTLCNGAEFNRRIKTFLNGEEYTRVVPQVRSFERDNNPPTDPEKYVDISEDNDGTIIAYVRETAVNNPSHPVTLYWFSDDDAIINDNLAYMFNDFTSLKRVDLSGFIYLNGLHDVRYMFANCRSLNNIKFKKSNDKALDLTEVQGMFFNCQSLTSIDFTYFTTYHVDNMDEMFYRCYNLRNIYVKPDRWNIESVRTFKKMFSDCYILKTNDGKKAVDIAEDDYEKFAVIGNDTKEGFLRDVNYTYLDYGESEGEVPIDEDRYLYVVPETIANYASEPESDGEGNGEAITPYVGDKSTGYGAEKETGQSASIYGAETTESALTGGVGTAESSVAAESSAIQESSSVTESDINVGTSEQITITENSNPDETIASEIIETEDTSSETENIEDSETSTSESDGRRLIEIDGGLEKEGGSEAEQNIFEDNTKFIIFALAISLIVILLLIGMVIYLFKGSSKKDHF